MSGDKYLMEVGEKQGYEEKGWFAEASFFKCFPIPVFGRDAATALTAPNAIVLTEDVARRYFGKADPINKTVKIDKDDFVVKGVVAKPSHFHFDFNYLMASARRRAAGRAHAGLELAPVLHLCAAEARCGCSGIAAKVPGPYEKGDLPDAWTGGLHFSSPFSAPARHTPEVV
jgi:hypothetical protein